MNIPQGRRPSRIYTPRVVINTLFNEECATVVLLYRIGLITSASCRLDPYLSMAVAILTGVMATDVALECHIL